MKRLLTALKLRRKTSRRPDNLSDGGVITTKSGVTVSSFAQKNPMSRLWGLLRSLSLKSKLGIVVVAILIAGSSWLLIVRLPGPVGSVCKDKGDRILDQARTGLDPLNPNAREDLGAAVSSIEKRTDFQTDSNCLYPVVVYYADYKHDGKKAREYFEQLKKVDNGKKFKTIYNQGISVRDLEVRVRAAETYIQDQSKASQYFGAPIEGNN